MPVEAIARRARARRRWRAASSIVDFQLPPRPKRSADAYLRFIPRTEMDIAVVGAGVNLTLDAGGVCTRRARGAGRRGADAAAGAGGGRGAGRAASSTTRRWTRSTPRPAAACKPIDDKRGTVDYRIKVAGVLARRAAAIAFARAEDRPMSKHHVSATVNGEPVEFLCEPQETLLDVLRDRLGLTGSKEGCGSGDCGACSVIVDGRLVCSCLVLGAEAEGRAIDTIEGMAQGDKLHPAAAASSSSMRRCNAASARRASWWRRRRCSTATRTRRRAKRATGSPAISAAAPATTRSSAPCMDAAAELQQMESR